MTLIWDQICLSGFDIVCICGGRTACTICIHVVVFSCTTLTCLGTNTLIHDANKPRWCCVLQQLSQANLHQRSLGNILAAQQRERGFCIVYFPIKLNSSALADENSMRWKTSSPAMSGLDLWQLLRWSYYGVFHSRATLNLTPKCVGVIVSRTPRDQYSFSSASTQPVPWHFEEFVMEKHSNPG